MEKTLVRLKPMNKKVLISAVVIISLVLAGSALYLMLGKKETLAPTTETRKVEQPTSATKSVNPVPKTEKETSKQTSYQNIKSPHFVSSNPANNAVLDTTTSKVTINFNFDLAVGSKITVAVDGNVVNTPDPTKISADKLSMSVNINPVEPANYKVDYVACWPDGSCHNGSFGFSVK